MTRHELIIAFAIALATRSHTATKDTNQAAVLAADELIEILKKESNDHVC